MFNKGMIQSAIAIVKSFSFDRIATASVSTITQARACLRKGFIPLSF